jgi:AAA domain
MLASLASLTACLDGPTPMPELDILSVSRGAVTAPAGCGKTQLIADSLKLQAGGKPALVLTHTNAGKAALEARLAKAKVPRDAYRVSTIDSWSIRLISKFPVRSGHKPEILRLENPGTDYLAVRKAAWSLLSSGDIADALKATYGRLVVDEYQDCTIPQHQIVCWAASVLPTCVLGDPLQAIFGFREPTVDWTKDVHHIFPSVGELSTPWRWKNAGADNLGRWLLETRAQLMARKPVDLSKAPAEVSWVELPTDANAAYLKRLEAAMTKAPTPQGTVLVIGDSIDPMGQRQVASKTPGATTVEAVDLRDLTTFGRNFDVDSSAALPALVEFAAELMTNLSGKELLRRVESLSKGTARKEANAVEERALEFMRRPSYATALATLQALEVAYGVRVYRPEVLHILKGALQTASQGEYTFREAVVRARERNRHLGRPVARRAVGSTLLLKGLEADVAVVLNPAAMDARHLYVALTRGAKRLVVCSATPMLVPM